MTEKVTKESDGWFKREIKWGNGYQYSLWEKKYGDNIAVVISHHDKRSYVVEGCLLKWKYKMDIGTKKPCKTLERAKETADDIAKQLEKLNSVATGEVTQQSGIDPERRKGVR